MQYVIEESFKDDKSKSNAPKAFIKGGTMDPASVYQKSISLCSNFLEIIQR